MALFPITPTKPFYGWYIVAVCWYCLLTGFGLIAYAYVLYFDSWLSTFEWSRGTIAASVTIGMLTITFLSPLIGKGTDKFGSRIVLIIGTTVLGLGFCLLRFMQEPWHLYCLCMLFYTGFSATSMATMSSLLGRWFFNRRGLAIGIAYTGVGFGGVIFALLTNFLITQLGWEDAATTLGLVVFFTQLPLVIFIIRSNPSDIGEVPDGYSRNQAQTSNENPTILTGLSLSEAAATAKFWILLLFFTTSLFSASGIWTQMQAFIVDNGYPASLASTLISINGFIAIFVKFGYGYFGAKLPTKPLLLFAGSMAFFAPFLMLSIVEFNAPSNFAVLLILPLAIGGTAFSTLIPIISAICFGIKHIGSISGTFSSAFSLGIAFGPLCIGQLYDLTGSYSLPSYIFCTISLASMIALILGPKLRYTSPKDVITN